MEGIQGKVAIVTGGASGLGAGLTAALVRAGVKVVVADILETEGQALQAQLGEACEFVRTDLRSDSGIDRLLARTEERFGGLDCLVNLACSYAEAGLQSTREQWKTVFDINLFGHALLMQKAVPLLKRSAGASIVNFSSASAHIAQMGRWVYPATKAAIEQMTRSAALELAADGIRVNAILPGMIAKDSYPSPEVVQRVNEMAARASIVGRMQQAQEVADTVLFMCSDHARYMTGACIAVDGGCLALGPLAKERHVPKRPPPPPVE